MGGDFLRMLDVTIGLALTFMLVSFIASGALEVIARIGSWRSGTLKQGIRSLLDDPAAQGVAKMVFEHPLVDGLGRPKRGGGRHFPSYIPAANFAEALMDAVRDDDKSNLFADARASIDRISGNDRLKKTLLAFYDSAQGDTAVFKKRLETWFDDAMDRTSGWYKRKADTWRFFVSLAIVALLNVNTLTLASALWTDASLRQSLVEVSTQVPTEYVKATEKLSNIAYEELQNLKLPIGWTEEFRAELKGDDPDYPLIVLGWLISAFAVSLGAPFWFDSLQSLLKIRAAGPKPPKSKEKADA